MLTAAAGLGLGGLTYLFLGIFAKRPPHDRSSVLRVKRRGVWSGPFSRAGREAGWQRKRLVILGIAMIVASLVLVAIDRWWA